MQNDKPVGFPDINFKEDDAATRPVPLHEMPMQARIDREMAVINKYHPRIGKSVDVFWGHANCVEYLQKLIMNGGDGYDNAKIGFRPDVLAALIGLANLHEENFPGVRPILKQMPGVF